MGLVYQLAAVLCAPSYREDSLYSGLLVHQSRSTGWNEKEKKFNGSTMKDRSDDLSHIKTERSATELRLAPLSQKSKKTFF